ncbi:chemotaxis protein CheW [Leptolyngbyaceae cyanobacterium CCMR0082]|uniref:Chemotaxis protein CheW n=2 Tax=Adonisia turfae TaxID=2950184 RepID=A0A6M0SB74_9CYAN|nr:chemotaxis protein CheW [Adonisia turfae]NEZ60088.1 chemotaxis protein CheW [Adonisia turfae CCMR0081]NEZ65717.1 chemotaxis protein CheW [Adonisia turfae CCMR0082]
MNTLQSPLQEQLAQIDPLGLDPIPEDTRQRFLRFKLLEEHRTLLSLQAIAEVQQLKTLDILPIPEVSNSMLGVCNWRGEILWLIDLNALVGNRPLWHQAPLLEQAMVIVVQRAPKTIGLVVEQVDDIELIEPQSICPKTDLCAPTLAPYVTGCLANHQGVILDTVAIIEHMYQAPP